ncbi:DUF6048 family protein [Mariniflexile gromovii]|uniref:Outer membrane protein with beta-barrel domain n=1 Tax=Mariniflexile gromovii TaxID=362523 RepID=A0ABS4BY73_9FLAO|nr:DUF6048 family protein [Mariniflexile gromovii]MBP0905540.1 hypothetical protein [Mariniflexile gromovii]
MKQKHILTYITSCLTCLLLCSVSLNAQNDSIANTVKDSVKIKEKYGLRVGGDIGKLVRSFVDDDYTGFEVSADFRLKKRLYIAGELGIEEKQTTTDYLNITTSGSYIKGGIDYNLYQNWLDMDNMIYAGFRVGASTFNQKLNSYTIYTTDPYWSPQFSSTDLQEFNGLTAFWGELILGIKAELLTNLYLGLNVQLKIMASQTEPNNFENVYIPGFNKTYDSTGIGAGYSYSLSYRIPLYKKDK